MLVLTNSSAAKTSGGYRRRKVGVTTDVPCSAVGVRANLLRLDLSRNNDGAETRSVLLTGRQPGGASGGCGGRRRPGVRLSRLPPLRQGAVVWVGPAPARGPTPGPLRVQVRVLRQGLLGEHEPARTPRQAHGRDGVPLRTVRAAVPLLERPEETRGNVRRLRRRCRRRRWRQRKRYRQLKRQ